MDEVSHVLLLYTGQTNTYAAHEDGVSINGITPYNSVVLIGSNSGYKRTSMRACRDAFARLRYREGGAAE